VRAPLAVVVVMAVAVPVGAVARMAPGLLARVLEAHEARRPIGLDAGTDAGAAARGTTPEAPPRLLIPSEWSTEAAW